MAYPWHDLILFLSWAIGDHILIWWCSIQNKGKSKYSKNISKMFFYLTESEAIAAYFFSAPCVHASLTHVCNEQYHA